jgi:hypothetical protein
MPTMECPDDVIQSTMAEIEGRKAAEVVEVGEKPLPIWYRFGVPFAGVAAICLVIFMISFQIGESPDFDSLTAQPSPTPAIDIDIEQAREQVELALGYVGYIGSTSTAAICEDIIEVKVAPTLQNAAQDVLDMQILPNDLNFI